MGRAGIGIALVGGVAAAFGLAALLSTPSRDDLLLKAERAIASQDWDAAERSLAALPDPGPGDWFRRANVAFSRGKDVDVLTYLSRIPAGHELSGPALALRGQAELRLHRARAAEESFLGALRAGARLPIVHRQLIFLYGTQDRRAAMLAQFEALAGSGPLSLDLMEHWCLSRAGLGDQRQALADLGSFLENDGQDRWSRIALAGLLRQSGEFARAEGLLSPLPEDDVDAMAERAQIALDRGEAEAAERLLSRGPRSHPRLARLRARAALARNRPAEAVEAFEEAEAAEPGNRETAIGMANALRLAGRQADAAAWTRKNQAFDTLTRRLAEVRARNVATRDELAEMARLCETAEMDAEAVAFLGLVLGIDPLDQDTQAGLRRLQGRLDKRKRADNG